MSSGLRILRKPCLRADQQSMRFALVGITALCALALAGPALASPKPSVAALQVALQAKGHYVAPIDGVDGPLTQAALRTLHLRTGIRGETTVGPRTRAARAPGAPLRSA